MEILLALGAAVSYGASDFTGGFLSKTTAVFVVVLVSQIVSLAVLVAVLPLWEGAFSAEAILWGAAAGIAGVAGASALYRGLSVGRMGVVAPISGVLAAGIPVLVGLSLGERPAPLAVAGVAVGLVAVVTVSRTPNPGPPRTQLHRLGNQLPRSGDRDEGYSKGWGQGWGSDSSSSCWSALRPIRVSGHWWVCELP